jgi:hypothetical protein
MSAVSSRGWVREEVRRPGPDDRGLRGPGQSQTEDVSATACDLKPRTSHPASDPGLGRHTHARRDPARRAIRPASRPGPPRDPARIAPGRSASGARSGAAARPTAARPTAARPTAARPTAARPAAARPAARRAPPARPPRRDPARRALARRARPPARLARPAATRPAARSPAARPPARLARPAATRPAARSPRARCPRHDSAARRGFAHRGPGPPRRTRDDSSSSLPRTAVIAPRHIAASLHIRHLRRGQIPGLASMRGRALGVRTDGDARDTSRAKSELI